MKTLSQPRGSTDSTVNIAIVAHDHMIIFQNRSQHESHPGPEPFPPWLQGYIFRAHNWHHPVDTEGFCRVTALFRHDLGTWTRGPWCRLAKHRNIWSNMPERLCSLPMTLSCIAGPQSTKEKKHIKMPNAIIIIIIIIICSTQSSNPPLSRPISTCPSSNWSYNPWVHVVEGQFPVKDWGLQLDPCFTWKLKATEPNEVGWIDVVPCHTLWYSICNKSMQPNLSKWFLLEPN